MRWPLLSLVLLLVPVVGGGCTTTKTITITTDPADALIRVDGAERGRGRITEPFLFKGKDDTYVVTVSRVGFKEQTVQIGRDFERSEVEVKLSPLTRRVTFTVAPVPAEIRLNGKAISGGEPVSSLSTELPFTVDANNRWTTYVVRAEREGFAPAEKRVAWTDQPMVAHATYALELQPLRKDVTITSDPLGATVVIDGQELGTTPLTLEQRPFPVDLETGEFVPQKMTLTKPGFPPVESTLSWDDGRSAYVIDLTARSKEVRVATDPPGAAVTIDGRELERDASGASVARLSFPPINEQGELKSYTAVVTKKTADSEWEPQNLTIGWDGGRTDYSIALKEILTRPVPLTAAVFVRGDEGWEITPKHSMTLAMKEVTEGPKRQPAVRLTQLWPGTIIDTLAVSPDGSNLVFSVLYGKDKDDFRSQIMQIRTDGAGGAQYITDGKTVDLTPSFTPAGDRIIYSSNRAGRRLAVCEVSITGKAGIRQLTTGTTNDIWPNIDADPQPNLYYQAMVDTRPDPRLYMSQLGTTFTTDLTHAGGTQPRVSPKADQVLYTAVNEKTGKRDIYLLTPDKAENPLNLTNTPDYDEFDPSWSRDGGRVVFASDRGIDAEKRNNYDIWMLDLRSPERPSQITINGSHDDCPVWDPAGDTIYFRSNRGGEWAIWKLNVE